MPHVWISSDDLAPGFRMFESRRTAGRALGQALLHHAGTDALVLGLPRGGVPVADEVARAIGGTLDVWVTRKLGAPLQPELGIGAIAEGPAVVIDRSTVRMLQITTADVLAIARREMTEVRRRVARYRTERPPPEVRGRTVIVVDDGIATGGTMRATIRAIRRQQPAHLVAATPVASPEVVAQLAPRVDEIVCLHEAVNLYAIGLWYEDFRQVPDEEVVRVLAAATRARGAATSSAEA
jgi:putative phosphoribosyl transferase